MPQNISEFDANNDMVLDELEVERLRKLGAKDKMARVKYETVLQGDKNQDGILDEEECAELQEMEATQRRLEVLQYIENRFAEIISRKGNYVNMFSFIMFVCFYFIILFYQRKSFLAYDITYTISESVLPSDVNDDVVTSFTSENDIYTWMADLVDTVWVDPSCGDGACQSPFEYPGFGLTPESHGCSADCGVSQFTSKVQLTVSA
ncbi:hypothetical protein CYMTET_29295, partial [Cymbomonas tetramitiformis]|eukprot:gene24857-30292_t